MDLDIDTMLHLLGLNCIPHLFAHCFRISRSFCRTNWSSGLCISWYIKQSSAKSSQMELSFRGTFTPWNFCSGGTSVPWEWTFQELSLPGPFALPGANVPRTGAPGEVHHPVLYSSIMCKLLVCYYTMTLETSDIQIFFHKVYKYPVDFSVLRGNIQQWVQTTPYLWSVMMISNDWRMPSSADPRGRTASTARGEQPVGENSNQ